MRLTIPLIVLLSVGACDSLSSGQTGQSFDIVVAVDDTLRAARIFVPDGIERGDPVHLIVALHGSGDAGPSFQKGSKLDEKVPANTVVAYPTAAKGNWAEGCNCNIADRLQINDLGFMEALIDSVGARYAVQRERTYAMGFSQGGLFAYRLACDLSDRFAAIAAVSAPMSEPLSKMCPAPEATSVMTFHGRFDSVLPWTGTDQGALSLLSAPETAVFWRGKLSCLPPDKQTIRSGDATLEATLYEGCRDGARVSLYEMPQGQHQWYTRSPDAREFVVGFFGL